MTNQQNNRATPWTPGPWEADGLTVLVPRGIAPHVAYCSDGSGDGLTDQAAANAQLIAAAPQLAEALREIIAAWKAYNLKPGAIGYEVARDMAEHARAALKAAGVE